MIHINDLTFRYNQTSEPALRNIHLDIAQGEFVGITGPTGAGKSTLSLCLSGVIPHYMQGEYYGQVIIDGKDTLESSCAALARSIGSVFQDPESQMVSSIVEDEIAFGLENLGIPRREMSSRIEDSLALAGIPHLKHASTTRLSGGQKQRVAIAAAIALRPRILVLDEPTSELDPDGSFAVFDTLRKLNLEYNMTIVVVEQKMQLLSEYCSRLVVMDKGSIVLDGDVRHVLSRHMLLQQLGVSCPPVTRLAGLLKEKGLYNGDFPINVEEAFLMVSKVLSERSLRR